MTGADNQPSVKPPDLAPWTGWVPFILVECAECSALVMDKPEARANHEAWHRCR